MENNNELIKLLLPILIGVFAILASIFNWDFFFESRKARLIMKLFGRKGSRIFYSIIGVILIYIAYFIYKH